MEAMWTFKTKNFTVSWEVEPCQYPIDLSWDDTGEVTENLQSGLYTAFDSKVAVYYKGQEISADYLSESIYENPADFRDHIGSQGKYGSYFTDMVRQAINDARREWNKPKHALHA